MVVSPPPQVADGASQSDFVQLISLPGGGVLGVFQDHRRSRERSDIYAVRFDPTGARLDAEGLLLSNDLGHVHWDPTAACLGASCLVAWRRPPFDVVAATFDPATGARGTARTVMNNWGLSAVTATPSNYVIVTQNGNTLESRLLSAAGIPTGGTTALATDANGTLPPVLLTGTSGVLVAWSDASNGPVRSRMLDLLGQPTAAIRVHAASFSARAAGVWDGSRFVLAWGTSSAVVIQRLDGTGAPIDASPVQVLPVAARSVALAYDGANLLLAWTTSASEASVTRVEPTLLSNVGPTARLPFAPVEPDRVRIAAGGRNLLTVEELSTEKPRHLRAATFAYLADGGVDLTPTLGGGLDRHNSNPASYAGAWDGSRFQVVWVEQAEAGDRLRAQLLSPSAAPLGPPVELQSGGTYYQPALRFLPGRGGQLVWTDGPPGATYGTHLWWGQLSASGLSAPTRVVTDVRGDGRGHLQTIGATSAFAWAGQLGGLNGGLRLSSLPEDGGRPSSPTLISSAVSGPTDTAFVGGTDAGLFAWGMWNTGLQWIRLSPQLAALDAPRTQADGYMRNVVASSNGEDFLVGYTEGYDTLRVRLQRISASGPALGSQVTVSSAADMPYQERDVSLAYDGQAYRVAYEVGGDGGTDVLWRRVWPDGGVEAAQPIAAGPWDEELPRLVEGGPGRVLALWRQWDPATGASRLYARTWTELPTGAPCADAAECASGMCAGAGICCDADAGPCAPLQPPDGGDDGGLEDADAGAQSDGGELGPRRLPVGCGCGAGGSPMAALLLTLLLFGRARASWRTKRGSPASSSRGP